MTRPASHFRGGRVFCDRECRKAFHRPPVACDGCGEPFLRCPQNPSKRYCSWECFKASRHVVLTCQVCGDDFDSYLSEQRKRDDRGHVPCCSRACRNVYTSLLLGGDGTWVEGGRYNPKRQRGHVWRVARKRYLDSVGWRCEPCGAAPATQVHHLHPTAAGGDLLDPDNLCAVCDDCHDNMHAQLRAGAFWCSFDGMAFDAALA